MVIWILGISGAGKTTTGRSLEKYFKKINKPCSVLDGDDVRKFFENDLGYTNQDREASFKRMVLSAHLLDKNNIDTFVCAISPFEQLRTFARKKITNYNEIYLKKDINKSIKQDIKKVYSSNIGKSAIVGIDIVFDEPQHSDVIIDVDKTNEQETFLIIKKYIIDKYGSSYDDGEL